MCVRVRVLYKLGQQRTLFFATYLRVGVYAASITSTPLFDKTDKTKPMSAFVNTLNPIVRQPKERGSSPLLYAAASPDLDGKPRYMACLAQPELRV